tara:strand:- start:325 stop:915 length:591 start_codon:yes stop_codon:yes gene_type:complete
MKQPKPFSILSDIIHQRRSIFPPMYTGEKVDDKIILELLNNANQAPSHKKTNPWRFHVISGDGLLRLASFFQNTYKENIDQSDYKEVKFKKLGTNSLKASHVIVVGAEINPESGLPEWEEIAAVAAAVQNLYLSVTAFSLGGYWSSPSLMINHIHEFIDLRKDEKCLGFFFIGIPQGDLGLKVEKGDIVEKVKWYR